MFDLQVLFVDKTFHG